MRQLKLNFFNTINQSSENLRKSQRQVENQGERIYQIMVKENRAMTPFEIGEIYNSIYNPVPITSIRRAISDLTDSGLLIKTLQQKEGAYGKPNYTWILNNIS